MAEQDIDELVDEYNCYLHGNLAGIPLNETGNGQIDTVSFQLFALLYLRQMKASDPDMFEALKSSPQSAKIFVAFHDRASFTLAAAAFRELETTAQTEPIKAEMAKEENQAIIAELRQTLCDN